MMIYGVGSFFFFFENFVLYNGKYGIIELLFFFEQLVNSAVFQAIDVHCCREDTSPLLYVLGLFLASC